MRTYVWMILLLCAWPVAAQVTLTGTVKDAASGESLAAANVLVKKPGGKLIRFGRSDDEGRFTLRGVPLMDSLSLEVTMMGFSPFRQLLKGTDENIDVRMQEGVLQLKEVTVKADRIREQGDTVTYTVGSFAQAQDRTIGDVLKRMPGIDVQASGKIRYQGEEINKFYIEGSDLLGGKYGIATNGIRHEDIGAVEVLENHQPLQVLSGISFSDKAAINLKLKERAKATWTAHGKAGGGYVWQPEGMAGEGELFAMAVMPSFQHLTTLKANNTGTDLSAQKTDFFANRRQTGLERYAGVSLPNVPFLRGERTLFNRSALVSSNSLWKRKKGEWKARIDYAYNHTEATASNATTYFLPDGDRVITEEREGTDRSHALSAQLTYDVNQRTTYVNNILNTKIDWDDVRLGVTGSLPNTQSVTQPDYFVSDRFKLIRRLRDNHLVIFEGQNEWESLPQTFHVTLDGNGPMRQQVGDHAFYTRESLAYSFSFHGLTVGLEGGLKGYLRSMNSELPEWPELLPGTTQNVVHTNYFTLYATPKLEYWINGVNISLSVPVSFSRYTFDQSIADRSEAYASPSLSLNWKPTPRWSFTVRGNTGRSPMNLSLIHSGWLMTTYRSFTQGVDDFYNSTSQSLSGSFSYRHSSRGLFANAVVMQSWGHMPYTLAQQLYGNYIVYSYVPAESENKRLMATGNVGKTLDFVRGSINLNGSYNRSESQLVSEQQDVHSVSTSWKAGTKVSGQPLSWMGIDYAFTYGASRLRMDDAEASWLGNLRQTLLFNLLLSSDWEWRITGEHYRNEIADNRFKQIVLLDTQLTYKLNKRMELSASLTNVLDRRTYSYAYYNQLASFESHRQLRGREFLLSISIKK